MTGNGVGWQMDGTRMAGVLGPGVDGNVLGHVRVQQDDGQQRRVARCPDINRILGNLRISGDVLGVAVIPALLGREQMEVCWLGLWLQKES